MRRLCAILLACAGAVLVPAALAAGDTTATAAEGPDVRLTPIARLPFPERGYIVDLPTSASVQPGQVRVTENGQPVDAFAFTPVGASGVRYGVVLAVDASNSMAGKPIETAIAAARSFLAQRGDNQRVGFVLFNGAVEVPARPTLDAETIDRVVAGTPELAYGTRIYDAAEEGLSLLRSEKIAAGAVVLLSDGADVGSRSTLDTVVRQAKAQRVRIFTVGLRSGSFDPVALTRLAEETGGRYVEAASTDELSSIYDTLGRQLAHEYLVQYRSEAAPNSDVVVRITLPGYDSADDAYTAPTPSALPPYHRSLLSRFLVSPFSLVVLALGGAVLVALLVLLWARRSRSQLVDRVNLFAEEHRPPTPAPKRQRRRVARMTQVGTQKARGWLASLDRDLDIADIQVSATRFAIWTLVGTAALVALCSLISPGAAAAALLAPLLPRAYVKRRVKRVRNDFADQLPPNLQMLAAALRAGYSFSAALAVAVDNAHEPSKRELRRAVTDDQIGVPMEEAVRRVSSRMASRDLEQVALLAELQRTTGGNAAEVLDVVVFTVRERADIRRLVKTLTAQGRMARWILTGLPIVTLLAGFLIQPDVMGDFLSSSGGQIALVFAGVLVLAGSLAIQRIVDIEV